MIEAEGTKTPAGCGGKVGTPQKAKCLKRKSTKIHLKKKISISTYIVAKSDLSCLFKKRKQSSTQT
ncbi:hypothetical protein D1B31_05255 [Neobacillus notoginsengisoli]|uniref:Uncharacterized protein n=1 Tax=Neobacillus notoginsengisoli TaxID=1578198 RepID=A0A417YX33_9BACI|nr:hypothetical protein [Neobacillus notoginsengisoli]RHW42050.1 hypothetical protein D1B31_05255 [Neobacillus notoginsengisoli]